jgi:hypothetical protein
LRQDAVVGIAVAEMTSSETGRLSALSQVIVIEPEGASLSEI